MSETASSPFSYDTLPDLGFRILELYPGNRSDPLRGKLHVRDGEPGIYRYECISYTWGSPDFTHSIELDGAMLPITMNLHDCLQDFRLPPGPSQPFCKGFQWKVPVVRPLDYPTTGSRYLWVDSVCINQKDDKEKAAQVSRMITYYTMARHVLVHLGRRHTGDQRLLDLINDFKRRSSSLLLQKTNRRAGAWLNKILLNMSHDDVWAQLRNVVSAPYWRRRWIVPELLKASRIHIHCGPACVSFEDFVAVVREASNLNKGYGDKEQADTLNLQFGAVFEVETFRNEAVNELASSGSRSLIRLLIRFRAHNASNPRDHIYSLLGLADESQRLGQSTAAFFIPTKSVDPSQELVRLGIINYEESVSACYIRFACCIVRGYDADVQSYTLYASSCGTRQDLPSWVPDWSTLNGEAHLYNPGSAKSLERNWGAATRCEPHMRLFGDEQYPRQIKLRSRIVDTVVRIGQSDAEATQDPRLVEQKSVNLLPVLRNGRRLIQELQQYLKGAPTYHGSPDINGAIMKVVLLGGCDKSSKLGLLIDDLMGCSEMDSKWIKEGGQSIDSLSATELEEYIWRKRLGSARYGKHYRRIVPHLIDIRDQIRHRRSCLTEKRYIGLLPTRAKVGDMILLPFGSVVPFVIRQSASGKGWSLIGDCYIEGMMHGEMAQSWPSEDIIIEQRNRYGMAEAHICRSALAFPYFRDELRVLELRMLFQADLLFKFTSKPT